MIHDIARSAVIRKTQKDVNILTGNYEAAFAIGLLSKICGIEVSTQSRSLLQMQEQIIAGTAACPADNERVRVLIRMLKDYKPSPLWDEDVEAMFERGLAEEREILSRESFFHS